MPEIDLSGPSPAHLSHALLFYEGGDRYDASDRTYVTRHSITDGVIQPGAPIDTAAVVELLRGTEKIDTSRAFVWKDQAVIAESPHYRLWYTPAGTRQLFRDGKEFKAWLPALVWIGHRSRPICYLLAYDGQKPPTEKTKCYGVAFGGNVHGNHQICVGTMNCGRFTPSDWMRGFFGSNFVSDTQLKTTRPYVLKKTLREIGPLARFLGTTASHESAAD